MTGPLAPLFAQVREGIGAVDADSGLMQGLIGREVKRVVDAFAAVSAIERHVQDMENLLRRVEPELVPNHDAAEALREKLLGGPPSPNAALIADIRAALLAPGAPHGQEHGPEKEEETDDAA